MTLEPKNPHLLERLRLFAVATSETWQHLDAGPFDLPRAVHIDPLHRGSTPFIGFLKRLDEVTFGPEGMPMPQWMYLNSVTLTGAIVGFGIERERASERACDLLGVPDDYHGLVPYAVYMAIPTFERGCWFGHNLASLRSHLPEEELAGLASLTKAVALRSMRTGRQLGATQWDSVALFVHCRLGPLELLTATTPAHGEDCTLTYAVDLDDRRLRHLAGDPSASIDYPEPDLWVDSRDRDQQLELQRRIEAGERFVIAGRPRRDGEHQATPVAELR